MINLKLYKNEKEQQNALNLVNAFAETRKMFNDIKEIADCENDKYTPSQKQEAKELVGGGFYRFVSIMISMRE